MLHQFSVRVDGQGLYPITDSVRPVIADSGLDEGLCTLFIRHTSASLLIQ